MRKCFALMAVVFLAGNVSAALAKDGFNYLTQAPLPGESIDDRPAQLQPIAANRGGACTLNFGYVDGDGFAVEGDIWTFDHGGADPFEGWVATDVTQQNQAYFRHITADIWANGDAGNGNQPTENGVAAPILSGLGSAWVGAFQNEADELCWLGGLGHGNSWCQTLEGPVIDYDTGGEPVITVNFDYFNDTELDFDYSYAIIQTLPSGDEHELVQFTDQIGLAVDHPVSIPVGANFNTGFSNFQADTQFRIIFKMTADGGWSDEDGQYTTEYGPFGVDNVVLGNTGTAGNVTETYDFESDISGFSTAACPGFGTFEGIADVSTYVIEDPCVCELEGNVYERHDDFGEHPYGQRVQSASPAVDVESDVEGVCSGTGQLEIFADWSQYSVQPRANGVFYRPGWDYFPFTCAATGQAQWSGRVGQASFFSTGDDAVCFESRNIATDNGIPAAVEQIKFIHELYASCDGFAIGPEECTNVTNFTPIIDNIQIRFTLVPAAPPLSFDPGDQYQDGFSQSLLLDPDAPGNADVTGYWGDIDQARLGDSLHVVGPTPEVGTEYDARLWFRIARKGPGATAPGYAAWLARVQASGNLDLVDGVSDIENGGFATAKMDSSQIGVNASSSRFHSYFIEQDARFDVGAGEITEGNEIIADGILLPGTAVEYFITSNYITTPNEFFVSPDTAGGFFREFEILPNWRDDAGTLKYPCLLYVDAFNGGAQVFIENAFDVLGIEADRYDYLDASSNWKAPLARGIGGGTNNGATIFQLLGYRGIVVNTGSTSGNVMEAQDYAALSDWLTALACDSNDLRQGLIMNGDNMAAIMDLNGPSLLNGPMGTTYLEDAYNETGGIPDENFCVQLEAPSVGTPSYGTVNSTNDYDYDAWGNWCPNSFSFDVLGTTGSGVGNRSYVSTTTFAETDYAQITNESGSGADNYRTVFDGVSYHHISERDLVEECIGDSAHIVTAAFNEISSALEWIYGVGTTPALCVEPCAISDDGIGNVPEVGAGAVTRLFQNSPNPFNPTTTLRFALAESGPVELAIYDVNGRKVKTLVSGVRDAGSHEVNWDGTDEAGKDLSSGIYWSQFNALGTTSNKKMVFLKR